MCVSHGNERPHTILYIIWLCVATVVLLQLTEVHYKIEMLRLTLIEKLSIEYDWAKHTSQESERNIVSSFQTVAKAFQFEFLYIIEQIHKQWALGIRNWMAKKKKQKKKRLWREHYGCISFEFFLSCCFAAPRRWKLFPNMLLTSEKSFN